jgi:threonine dehydrogenase-like Zn-dependent dehydrogenase
MRKYTEYREAKAPVPDKVWAWNLYGAGLESLGRNGQAELVDVPEPDDDQLLVRVDSVSLCFSDLKIIKLGRTHPKLYNRDMQLEPTRLGHEVAITVIKAGKNLQHKYYHGQRLAVQPDIYQDGKSTAYGYTVPGGLIQYHVIGKEVLKTDAGECLLPVNDEEMSYAGASLLEPWGCVLAAYTHRRRLTTKTDGTMWILGDPDDQREYQFSAGLDAPGKIILTDVPPSVKALVEKSGVVFEVHDNLQTSDFMQLSQQITGGIGFDDIVVLNPTSAERVGQAARLIARRGTMNLVGQKPMDDLVETDLGRLHYDYIAFLGNDGSDIGASYGEKRNRCELIEGGLTVVMGAGGPMGQMHVQRALEKKDGPAVVVATELNDERLATLEERFVPLAGKNGKKLLLINPQTSDVSLHDLVMKHSDSRGADDVVVCVPVASLMAAGAAMMNPDGMLVLFAGVPNGTMAKLDLSRVFLNNAQYTGTSGLTIEDQILVLDRAQAKGLSPELSVAAIGGMKTVIEAYQALMDGRFPGKIVIYPQFNDLPLLGLAELEEKMPEVAKKLGPGYSWTQEAEAAMFDHYWQAETQDPSGGK